MLFRNQIPAIDAGLCSRPEVLGRFREDVKYRKEFDVVDQSSIELGEVYRRISEYRTAEAAPSWAISSLFQQMDMVSRVFIAKVELSYAEILLTRNEHYHAMALGFGLRSELS